jgi:hypothetical protein
LEFMIGLNFLLMNKGGGPRVRQDRGGLVDACR